MLSFAGFIAAVFCLALAVQGVFSFPYVVKPFLAFVLILGAVTSYYMDQLGVIIDRDMIQNVMVTTVTVLHQIGSHGPTYYLRYPEAFERFKPACRTAEFKECTAAEITNAYSPRPKPPRVTGLPHLWAAAGYSCAGLRRLWQETAFRHIVLALLLGFGLLAIAGAEMTDYAILLILFFSLIATEAFNTAVECIVDHLAPDRAAFARDAKDLGALATMCLLCANGVFLGAVLLRSFVGE